MCNNSISLFKLFLIFVKIGAILLGGGYVILPIITNEFATKRNLVSEDDIINFFAISQSLPGIIAANMVMFIGYKLRRSIGAVTAMIGVILVPFISIILLASIISILVDNSFIKGALSGIEIAVIALIILTVKEAWQKSTRDVFFYTIFIMSLASMIIFHLSPIQVIILFSIIGIIIKTIQRGES